jgi:hypothetical protein
MKIFKIKDWFAFIDLDDSYYIFLGFYLWNKNNPFVFFSVSIDYPIKWSWEWQYSEKLKKDLYVGNDVFYSASWDDRVTEYKFFYKALGFFSISLWLDYFN